MSQPPSRDGVIVGAETVADGNRAVPTGWDDFPFAALCGHTHARTAETA